MQQIQRHLQISVYLMAALSSLMLGMGEQVWSYVAILWIAAFAAYFYTDRWQWVILPRMVSNSLALAAGALALYEIIRGGQEYQLIGVAHFLIYLQIVIFFQKKGPREYTHLTVLSLFQVMVAAIINLHVSFAALLVAELFLGIWVLLLLQLSRQWQLHREGLPGTAGLGAAPGEGGSALRSPPSAKDAFRGAMASGSEGRIPTNRLARVSLLLGFLSLAIAIFVFPIVPRVRKVQWAGNSAIAETGLNQDVQLGEFKKVLESTDEVLTIALARNGSGEVYQAPGELLLRGYVLGRYSNGRWERTVATKAETLAKGFATDSIRQEIELYKNEVGALFAMQPIDTALYGPDEDRPLQRDRPTGTLLPPDAIGNGKFRYTVFTPPVNLLAQYTRDLRPPEEIQLVELTAVSPGLVRLREFAKERAQAVVPEPDATVASQLRIARNFEAYFLDSNRFTYSLDAVLPEGGVAVNDPVEEFLFNHKTGYCEYFASALTLMLRAVEIPARMVAGYKRGEYNDYGNYYVILDKDAHNWVEAYVADSEGKSRWIVLDPTPTVSELNDVEISRSWYAGVKAWIDYLQRQWSNNVVDLDRSSQEGFLRDKGHQVLDAFERWREQVEDSGTFEGLFSPSGTRTFWGRVSTLVVATIALAILGLLIWLLVRGVPRLLRRIVWGRRSAGNGQVVEVEFYRRLIEILKRHDLVRPPACTHREFARLAYEELESNPQTASVAEVPHRVIDLFHQVRFGHEAVAPEQEAELATVLAELEASIEAGNGDRAPGDPPTG